MKLLILNYPYLAGEMKNLGMQTISAGMTPDCDLVFSAEEYSLDNILRRAAFDPDFVVFMDSVERIVPVGLEKLEVPFAACFIDSPINRFWQIPLAQAADISFFDQQPEAATVQDRGGNSRWFPLAADHNIYKLRGVSKEFDITFVGGRNPLTRQKRENILKTVSRSFNLKIFDGNPRLSPAEVSDVYNRSRLVLNENLFPSMNLRMFEAMGCGSAVLTENSAPGLSELFTDGVQLVGFDPDNLLERIGFYLENESERELIAARGYENIRRNHTLVQRAAELKEILESFDGALQKDKAKKISALGQCFLGMGLKWGDKNPRALNYSAGLIDESLAIKAAHDGWMTKGKLLYLAANFREAKKCFEQAAICNDTDFRPDLFSALACREIGDQKESARLFGTAVEKAGARPAGTAYREVTSPEFHMFWGTVFRDDGDAVEPGLMKFHLPKVFWTALEHYRYAAELDGRYWEAAGDLLAENHAPEAALQAYGNRKGGIKDQKRKNAERQAYTGIQGKLIKAKENNILSLCMIVKNEEENLREILSEIGGIPDQIIIGDTGSSDKTVEIALTFRTEVMLIPWADNFADARNRTLEKARGRYVIYLDGDDRVDPEELRRLKKQLQQANGEIFFVEIHNTGNGEVSLQKRVFPNRPDLRFEGAIHEQVTADPQKYQFVKADLTVHHRGYDDPEALRKKSYRNLKIIETELIKNPGDFYLHYHAALCRMNLSQEMPAVEHLRKIVFSENSADQNYEIFENSLILLSRIFKRLGDKKTAVKLLQSVPKKFPAGPAIHYHLGVIYFEEQLYAECRLEMEEFFSGKIEPRGIPVPVVKIEGWAHYYLGRCLERQGHLERALDNFKSALEKLGNPAKLFIDISRVLNKTGMTEEAIRNLETCLEIYPASRAALKMLENLEKEKAGCE